MTSLADIHAWAGTTRSIAVCHICAAAVTVGVDAHDAGISADGVELFACGRCCGVAWIARRIAAVIAEHRRPRHPLAPPRPLLIRNTTTKGTRP